jgi:hypothetical protein
MIINEGTRLAPCKYLDLDKENGAQASIADDKDSAKEQLPSNNNEVYKTANNALFDSFLLNEIKAQDDAIRQVMSISGLLIGAYATVIVNGIGKIPASLLNNEIWIRLANITRGATGSESQNFYYWVFLIPLVFWIYALMISVMNLSPSTKKWPHSRLPGNINRQQDEGVVAFLMETAQSKYRTYKLSSLMIVLGLMAAIIIAMLSMPRA